MATYMPWTWHEPQKQFYKYDGSGNLIWTELNQAGESGVNPSGQGWVHSPAYRRSYTYEYGIDNTILETLWSYPGPPEDTETDMRKWPDCSEWKWSDGYNSYYRLMYGEEHIVLKTIWEPSSTKEAEMLINSVWRAVHFAYRDMNYATISHYIPIQYRASEDDRQRQRDDRNDRNRHGKSGYRDSDPSGGGQHPDNGDRPDNGDDTQSSPENAYHQRPPNYTSSQHPATTYTSPQYPATAYPSSQYPAAAYPSSQYPTAAYPSSQYPAAACTSSQYPANTYPTAQIQ